MYNRPENETANPNAAVASDSQHPETPEQKRERLAAISRANGAKSRGPATPEGKAISSKNALIHGYAAEINTLIRPEDLEAWQRHLDGYRQSYNPTNYAEADLVDELASVSFRKARLVGIETALIDFQMQVQERNVDAFFTGDEGNPRLHLALAWQGLSRKPLARLLPAEPGQPYDPSLPPEELDIQSIELVRRYIGTLDRQFRNALLNLRQYRKDFAPFAAGVPIPQAAAPAPAPEPMSSAVPEGATPIDQTHAITITSASASASASGAGLWPAAGLRPAQAHAQAPVHIPAKRDEPGNPQPNTAKTQPQPPFFKREQAA